jgi:hypothetical protein
MPTIVRTQVLSSRTIAPAKVRAWWFKQPFLTSQTYRPSRGKSSFETRLKMMVDKNDERMMRVMLSNLMLKQVMTGKIERMCN